MIAHIQGKVDDEMLNMFINMYNKNEDEYIVYFSSSGGMSDVANAIIDLINRNIEKTKLISYFQLASAGFEIFFKAKCQREIINSTIGMYHLTNLAIDYNSKGEISYYSGVAQKKEMLKINYPESLEFCNKLGFTQSELRKYNKGEDVYFLSDRLQEFLNTQKDKVENEITSKDLKIIGIDING